MSVLIFVFILLRRKFLLGWEGVNERRLPSLVDTCCSSGWNLWRLGRHAAFSSNQCRFLLRAWKLQSFFGNEIWSLTSPSVSSCSDLFPWHRARTALPKMVAVAN